MRLRVRENALCAFLAAAGTATMAWLGLYGFAWNDYDTEARPAFDALVQGHVLEFLRLAPAYGGSLVERAPFALAARAVGRRPARRVPHGRAALPTGGRRARGVACRADACCWSHQCFGVRSRWEFAWLTR